MIKLSDYVFQFLQEKGVQHAFMLPGGGAMHLDDSIGRSGIQYICTLHEQAAAVAAEAYAQHTNRIGVCLTTSGPGATNAITGITAGWIDSTPMFVPRKYRSSIWSDPLPNMQCRSWILPKSVTIWNGLIMKQQMEDQGRYGCLFLWMCRQQW